MSKQRTVVSLVAALVVVSVLTPAVAWTAGAQEDGEQASGLVVESLDAPAAVAPFGTLTVTATVANPTDDTVTEEVAFRLEGNGQNIVLRRPVTVEANATTNVTFEVLTTNFDTGDDIVGVTTANSSQFAELHVTRDALVQFAGQETNGTEVVVDWVFLPAGGYVAIHDATLLEGDAIGSVVGVSEYLEPGYHENVTVTLYDVPGANFSQSDPTENRTLTAMAHVETTNDTAYDFVTSNGVDDVPYLDNGEAVTDSAPVNVTSVGAPPADGDQPTGTTGGAGDGRAGNTTGTADGNATTAGAEDDGNGTAAGPPGDDSTVGGDGNGTETAGENGTGADGTGGSETTGDVVTTLVAPL